MTVRSFIKLAEKWTIDNSPTLLTAFGVTGTLTTAYLTGKASFKAADVIRNEQARLDLMETSHPLETKEKVKLVWKEFIPPAISVVTTIGCIVAANTISQSRAAALAAAFTLAEKNFGEYKEKVKETFGENKERDVRDQVAQDKINQNPPTGSEIQLIPDNKALFYDAYSSRYFLSTMETLKKAMNDLNYRMIHGGETSITLSDWYHEIGLANTKFSDEIGWRMEDPLDLHVSTTMSDDDRPMGVVDFHVSPVPIRHYHGIH